MAEKTIVVCDICGRPATESATIKVARGNFVKDLCATHVNELTAGARRPRPGRPRKLAAGGDAEAPRRRGRPRKSAGRKSAARKSAGRKSTRRKSASRKSAGRKSTGRKAATRTRSAATSAGS